MSITDDIKKYIKRKRYLRQAVRNLEARHINIGDGYATALVYYADKYIRKLLDIVKPQEVILWNEFYAFHSMFDHICKKLEITVKYMEFGCIPGTIVLEEYGQQGESYPARYFRKFNRLVITEQEIDESKQVAAYIKNVQLNRNIQPNWGKCQRGLLQKKVGRPVITYMGQNDYESGMYPYTRNSKRFHSPIFESTLQGLEYISMLAIKNDWNLVYKPHPIIDVMGSEKAVLERMNCLVVEDANIHELIDCSDVIVTILSQVAYVSLFRDKPVVLLGYMQLRGSGAVYEAYRRGNIERTIGEAIQKGYTAEQKECFNEHIARELKYYLYDDMVERNMRYGMDILSTF